MCKKDHIGLLHAEYKSSLTIVYKLINSIKTVSQLTHRLYLAENHQKYKELIIEILIYLYIKKTII